MSEPKKYTEGTFCWSELGTSDIAACKSFYTDLFGWNLADKPMPGDMGTYTTCNVGDGEVAGMSEISGPMSEGQQPCWMAYIWVDDCDAKAAEAEKLGAKLMGEVMEVPEVGRMCWLEDPSGATVGLFQGKPHPGAAQLGEIPGTFCWNELMTDDVDAATSFYTALLGWTATVEKMPTGAYTIFTKDDKQVAGLMKLPVEMKGAPPYWGLYVAVSDCDGTAAKAKELGGQVVAPPMDIPGIGRFACVTDPSGAAISVIKLANPNV